MKLQICCVSFLYYDAAQNNVLENFVVYRATWEQNHPEQKWPCLLVLASGYTIAPKHDLPQVSRLAVRVRR